MDGMLDPQDPRLSQAWDILKAQSQSGDALAPESNRLAFATNKQFPMLNRIMIKGLAQISSKEKQTIKKAFLFLLKW